MAGPIYGYQTIRFAETFKVDNGAAIREFRLVKQGSVAGSAVESAGGSSLGVAQYEVRDNDPATGFASDEYRLVTVATSGNLLVECQNALVNNSNLGTALYAVAGGIAAASTAVDAEAVTINGTTPIIRDFIQQGDRSFALVSFA